MHVMKWILVDIPEDCDVFLDDIPVKEPISRYDEEEVLPGVCCFMFKHLQSLNWILYNIELTEGSVTAEKCYFFVETMKIVGFVCDFNSQHSEKAKIIETLDWSFCMTVYKVHAFVDTCDYYCVWIVWFAVIADSLYHLCWTGVTFVWEVEQQMTMNKLKLVLISFSALKKLDYSIELPNGEVKQIGEIIVACNMSEEEYETVLMQSKLEDKECHSGQFESGVWSSAEKSYDADKQEHCVMLKALKKFHVYVYKMHFLLEVDAAILVHQLNCAATDLSGSLVIWWIAWIQLFDFTAWHVSDHKNAAVDGLSQWSSTADDIHETEEDNTEKFLDYQFSPMFQYLINVNKHGEKEVLFLDTETEEWSEESLWSVW